MKKIYFITVIVALIAASAITTARAQVSMGSIAEPQAFSALELFSNHERGLRLPQMTTAQRNAMQATNEFQQEKDGRARGLRIFNTTTRCINTWNGLRWLEACSQPCGSAECEATLYPNDITKTVDVPTLTGGTLTFLTYNLGACAELTPKQQMAYRTPFVDAPYKSQDATVYGGLFQWGRFDYTHATRCAYGPSTAPDYYLGGSLGACYNNEADYLAAVAAGNAKIASSGGITWINSIQYVDFWANGEKEYGQGVTNYSGQQNRHNPCPAGFRVPTQYEWASIGFEGGQVSVVATDSWSWYDIDPITGNMMTKDPANPGFAKNATYILNNNLGWGILDQTPGENNHIVWISVVDGKPSYDWDVPTQLWSGIYGTVNYPRMCGYALYTPTEWAKYDPSKLLSDDAQPAEPLMFLPAAGLRSGGSGALCNTGYTGSYWSSTLATDNYYNYLAYTMQLYGNFQGSGFPLCASFAIETNTQDGANCISSGRSVRCVADNHCSAPIIDDTQVFCLNGSTPEVSDLLPAPSTTITWYDASSNTPLSPSAPLADNGQYYCIYSDGACTSPRSNTRTVDLVDPLPALGSMTGPTEIHRGETGIVYSIPAVTGTNISTVYYEWSVPPGCTITSGAGTNSITIDVANDAPNTSSYNLNVRVHNTGYCGGASNVSQNVSVLCASPPAAPTGSDVYSCGTSGSGYVTLTATPPAGCSVWWYTSTGYFYSSNNSISFYVSYGSSTTYYAESRTADGCISATRTPITAYRVAPPAIPTSPTAGSTCGPGQVTLSVVAQPNCTVDWYSTGGTLLASGTTSFTTPTISTSTTYRARSRNLTTGCISSSYQPVTATVTPIPAQPSTITCSSLITDGSSGVTFSVTSASGVTYTWAAVEYTLIDNSTSPPTTTTYTSVPANWFTVTSGAGTSTISTTIDTQGTTNSYDIDLKIRVTPSINGCAGPAREVTVRVQRGF